MTIVISSKRDPDVYTYGHKPMSLGDPFRVVQSDRPRVQRFIGCEGRVIAIRSTSCGAEVMLHFPRTDTTYYMSVFHESEVERIGSGTCIN